jgi:putative transposase
MQYRRVRIQGLSYFFTVIAYRRQTLLGDAAAVEALGNAILNVQSRRPFEVTAQVILPDHMHALWTLPEGDDDYPTRWRLIKEAFTRWHVAHHGEGLRSKSRIAKGEQAVWQRRYWEHTIRNDTDFDRHFDYIHFNPVKHKLVEAPRDWPHSTFQDWVAKGRYDVGWGSDRAEEIAAWRTRE